MGIEFPPDFEKRIMEQDRTRRLDEVVRVARLRNTTRDKIIKEFLVGLGVTSNKMEKRLYRILLGQPKGKGMTMDLIFHSLGYDYTVGEIKDVLQYMKFRRHVRHEDPFGWMLIEEIHDKFKEIVDV